MSKRGRPLAPTTALRYGDAVIAPDLVIDNGTGEPLFPASFSTGWRRFAKAHGFEGITSHGLRHGVATLLLASGVPDKVALEVMGHADTRILRRYQAVADELKRDAASRMEASIAPSATTTPTAMIERTSAATSTATA